MPTPDHDLRILLLEDSLFDAELAVRELRKATIDFSWKRVETRSGFEQALADYRPDLILADYNLPAFDGSQALSIARERCPEIPVIIVTGAVGEDTAVELFKNGATDFVLKERLSQRLVPVVRRALEEASNRRARMRNEEQQAQLVADLRHLATHDHLTGTASRSLVLDRLEAAIRMTRPDAPDTALFSIDLDHFRQINTTYGMNFGDQLLVETARRLSLLCGDGDLVGNFGGDRFFVIFRRPGLAGQLPDLQRRMQACFSKPFALRQMKVTLQASIGGVLLDDPRASTLDVLAQCDEAVRRVKSGKETGVVMVDEPIIAELRRRTLLDKEVAEAVAAKRIILFFQPIVNLETGRITGAEALLRLRRPDGSLLEASGFMDALVRTGSLAVVDEILITEFLETQHGAASELMAKEGFRFSYNVSPGILANVGYAQGILSRIAAGGASPSSFTAEILEEGLLPTNGTVAENIRTLRNAGMMIAVDDFGIGYSNLLRLSRLPIQELKIPRELVSAISSGDSRMLAVLETTVGIARNLHALIVAEGVETQQEADHMRALGCQHAQGYLYGKAMPLEELLCLAQGRE